MDPERLELNRDEMRALGYAVVDMLVDHFDSIGSRRAGVKSGRQQLEALFREPPPEQGTDPHTLLATLRDRVFASQMHVDHPRFFGFVPSPSNFVGVMADALASGFNSFVGTWFGGSGPAEIELVTIDWLRQLCGMPESTGGLFVSGGSVANLTALVVARAHRLGYNLNDAVVYFSDQTHSSVERALGVLGLAPAQLRRIPSDAAFRLPMDALEREVALDRSQRRRPFCVIANAGTTNTGAVDPLPELAEFCRAQNLWLHADGAFGAAAVLSPEGQRVLQGLGEVDSLSLDPHKWLFQPFEIGCTLVRDGALLKNTFRVTPEYLRDVHRFEEEVNFCDRGVQLTRSFRALKLWFSLKAFGLPAFRAAITHGIHLAEVAEQRLRQGGLWEVIAPAQLAVVSFCYAGKGEPAEQVDAVNQGLVGKMLAEGFAVITSTTLRGRTALRLCTVNPRTTEQEIHETIDRLEQAV